jgi:hypothetical protein
MISFPVLRNAALCTALTVTSVFGDTPDAVVTFHEIHYNPVTSQEAEWLELHNQMAVAVDLSGWSLADGISYTFPQGTVIPGGGFMVVAKSLGNPALAGLPGVVGPFSGNLSNSGETIDLLNRSGRLMDRLEYADRGEWPIVADGLGATLAKQRPGLISGSPKNWRASIQAGGTPGSANFPTTDEPILHEFAVPGANWRFLHSDEAPSDEWRDIAFDDREWSLGEGPIGTELAGDVLRVTAALTSRYRAGAVTGVNNGSTFSPWRDESLEDGVAQNAARTSNPRFTRNATPTGEPVIRFDGNDAFRASGTPGIGPSSGFVYFIVCKANGTPSSGAMGSGDGAYLFDRDPEIDAPLVSLKAVNGRYGFQIRYDDGSGLGGPISTTAISTSEFQVVAVRRDPAVGRFEIWVDGVMEASTFDTGGDLTPQPIVIGRHGSQSNGFEGDIAEVLIYNDAMEMADFQAVGGYLSARYGVETAFPTSQVTTILPGTAKTTYFRQSFNFTGDPSRTQLLLDHTFADGVVIYLNGKEISRTNLPEGEITDATRAVSKLESPTTSATEVIPSSTLRHGTNVLSASVHTADDNLGSYFAATLRGREAPPDPNEIPALQLSEIASVHGSEFFVEIHNPHPWPATADHVTVTLEGTSVAELPASVIPPGGFLHLGEDELGGRPTAGARIVLRGAGGAILDAQLAETALRGRSGRWPDRWLFPSTATPGEENHFEFVEDVVINEICYNPVDVSPESAGKEWLELYNNGETEIELGGWRFDSGITYTFPPGTVLDPGGFLVLAKNPGSFPTPSGTRLLGPFGGNLSNGGELLRLVDSFGNPVNEVSYLDGGRWPGMADGEGSSLELRDSRSDNASPEAWQASDESARRAWTTHTYEAVASPSSVGPDNQWRDFVFGLIDGGMVFIDDISVIENPTTAPVQMVANGNFNNGVTGWRLLGNHRNSRIVPDPDDPTNNVLLIDASGGTEHMHNHIETTLANDRQVVNGRTYRISYRARWLSGSNRLNTRLYFNRLAKTTVLNRTDVHGTPGSPNSRAVQNAGPTFAEFSHDPAVPAPGMPVTVTVRAADPDGLGNITLNYSVDGGPQFTTPMVETARAGVFSASIPGQSAARVVRFHVEASDAAEVPATAWFPRNGAASHALYQVDDGLAATNGLHNIRIIMTPQDKALLYRTNNLMSNGRIGCTVIYNEREVYYNVGVRLKSSQRGRPSDARVGFNLGFNKDQLFRDVHRTIAIDRSEGVVTGCKEILFDHMIYASGGIPAENNDLCQVIAPNPAHTSPAILQLARFGDVFLDSQFPDGGDGTVYEFELIYYPTTSDSAGYKLPQPDGVVGVNVGDMGNDQENYRWTYLQKNNESVDEYGRIMAMAKHFSKSGAAFEDGLEEVIDVDQWLRALAYSCASGAGDSFFDNSNHNGQFYARPDGRVLYFPHDMDYAFDATRNIFSNRELQKLTVDPTRRRAYLGHLHDICTTVFNSQYMSFWANHYGSLLPNQNFAGHLSYINTRSNYILNAVQNSVTPVSFEIVTNGGADFSADRSPVTLTGRGWVDVRGIRLAGSGIPLEIVWTNTTTWTAAVPLSLGTNVIALEAVNYSGEVVGTDTIGVTYTGTGAPPDSKTLAISKIYYNPPGSQETEYIELLNTGDGPLDLSYVNFTAGITFTFPAGTSLLPGTRILVVKNSAEFMSAFGAGLPIAGSYPNNLSNGGELIELRRADGGMIHSFTYSDQPPWPVEADGGGYALVLVDPFANPDPADPFSWRASFHFGGNPGASDVPSFEDWRVAHGDHASDEDRDGDGLNTLLEYFLGGDPQVPDAGLAPVTTFENDGHVTMAVTRRVGLGASSELRIESSADLDEWLPAPDVELLGVTRLPGLPAKERLTFRLGRPEGDEPYFLRMAFGSSP